MRLKNNFRLDLVAGEYMLLDTSGDTVNFNKVFSLNEPAAWLWRKIGAQEFDEPMLVEWICQEYEVSRDDATADVSNMVRLWQEYNMIF